MPHATPFLAAKICLDPPSPQSSEIRTLPELLEYNSRHNPEHLFCLQAKKRDKNVPYELISVTHLQLKRAVLQCSNWIVSNIPELELPQRQEDGEVVKGRPVALFMESDVGLVIQLLSLLSLGIPAVLLSARLSPTAINHLLVQTSAAAIIVSPRLSSTVETALSELIETGKVVPTYYAQPSYETFLNSEVDGVPSLTDSHDHYFNDLDRNVLILHSSGTTGLPKALYSSHRFLLGFAAAHEFASPEEAQGLAVSTLPLFHGYGLVTPFLSMGTGLPFCLPAPSIVPTGTSTVDLLEATKARSLLTVPSILEDISLLPDQGGIQALQNLTFVAFGGGPLKESVGGLLEKSGVKLLNHYGATEIGPLAPIFVPKPPYDWRYFKLRKDMPVEMVPVESAGEEKRRYKLVARPFGWTASFELQDHLVTDEKNPGTHFTALGRKDDLIVLATGEKIVPQILESLLSESKHVKEAIAFGQNQFEIGVIVEPSAPVDLADIEQFKSIIWPIIQEASKKMDSHAQISSKGAIIVAQPDKSFPRTDKGSVMRKEVYRVYGDEISKVYQDLEYHVVDGPLLSLRMDSLEQDLKNIIHANLAWRVGDADWDIDDDFFELGMNSLQATRLRRLLVGFIRGSDHPALEQKITREFVYQYPSISDMANELRQTSEQVTNGHCDSDRDEIEMLQKQYSLQPSNIASAAEGSVILLTGATGSLGAHLLACLIALPNVDRVICLNRPHDHAEVGKTSSHRLMDSCREKGAPISSEAWSKVEVIETNCTSQNLGLADLDYARFRGQVTQILHCAWPVDFKRGLSSFKLQFQTVNNLLNFTRDCHAARPMIRPRFMFISSIAVVGQYFSVHQTRMVPEVPMGDSRCTNGFGYGKAKLVCERIVENAAQNFPAEMEATSVRLGQIAGSSSGFYWNSNEHIPALIKSSQTIKALPLIKGTLSWLPVNIVAKTVTEILFDTRPLHTMYHVENPNRQSWYDVLETLRSELGVDGKDVPFLPLDEWAKKANDSEDGSPEDNPAKKLGSFFAEDFARMAGGSVVLETDNARMASPTLRGSDVLSEELLRNYVKAWKSKGFLM